MIERLLRGEITQKEVLTELNANITYIWLPKYIYGFVKQYKCINNIFINKELSYYKKRNTILHELAHIALGQLEQVDNDLFAFKVDDYEDEADRYISFLKEYIDKENKNLNKILNELK